MTGARIEITVDDATVQGALAHAQARLAPDGMADLLHDIGEFMVRATRERAEREVSPEGVPWDALTPRYAARKAKKYPGAKILHRDFHMLGDQFAAQVDGDTLRVGTHAVYGAIHQFGGTVHHGSYQRIRDRRYFGAGDAVIPARPWLGVSAEDADEIHAIVLNFLRGAVEGEA